MVLGKGTIAVMKDVLALYDQLQEKLNTLDKCIQSNTDNSYTVCSLPDSMKTIHFVKLKGNADYEDIRTVADEGSIRVDWRDEDTTCYSFNIEGAKCMVLTREDNDEE